MRLGSRQTKPSEQSEGFFVDDTPLAGVVWRVLSMTADMTAGSLPSMLAGERLYLQGMMI